MSRKETLINFNRGEQRLSIRALWAGTRILMHCHHRLELRNPWPLPATGPAILTCNHISGIDPLFIQSISKRTIVWMMAKEFYEVGSLNWMFRTIDAIPVGRGGRDMAAMRSAMRALQSGRILGIFPEGRIAPTRELMEFQTGVALMAYRLGVDVYPAFLEGTQRQKPMVHAFLEPQEAALSFGEPIRFEKADPDRARLEEATGRIKAATEALRLAENQRRVRGL